MTRSVHRTRALPDPAGDRPHATRDDADLPALEVRQALLAIARRWWLLVLVAGASVGVAALFVRSEQPQYTARATIRLVDSRRALTGNIVEAANERNAKPNIDPLLSQIELLMSRATAAQVIDSGDPVGTRVKARGFPVSYLRDVRIDGDIPGEGMDTVYLDFTGDSLGVAGPTGRLRVPYGSPVRIGPVRFALERPAGIASGLLLLLPREAAIEALRARLRAVPRPKTDIVEVEYRAYDPNVAQRVVNTVVSSFRSSNALGAQQQSRRRREFVEAQLRRNDSLLVAAESTLAEFRRREQAFSSRDKFVTERTELAQIDRRVEELTAERQRYASALRALRGAPTAHMAANALVAIPELLVNPVAAKLYDQLSRYQVERDSLTVGAFASSRQSPDVVRLDTLIGSAQSKLVDAVEGTIAGIDSRLTLLERARARGSLELRRLPDVEAREVRRTQEMESLRAITDRLREEYQKAQIDEAVEAGQVEIVDLATRPRRPDGLPPTTVLALALIAGLVAASGFALLIDRLNHRIRRRDELQRLLGVRELAVIPRLSVAAPVERARGIAGHALFPAKTGATPTLTPAVAEPYRMLRTNLVLSNAGRPLHSVVVTSPSPGEGKTTVASNLAASFVRQGLNVLLVDCDVMRPSLHRRFGVPLEPGLTDVLLHRGDSADATRWIEKEGLTLLAAGRLAPDDEEAVLESGIRALLDTMRERFDMIVIDAPPLLVASDAILLGSLADGVVLVVRAGQTEREDVVDAVRQLDAVNVQVLGTVLNDPDARLESYGRRHYYSYSYSSVATT